MSCSINSNDAAQLERRSPWVGCAVRYAELLGLALPVDTEDVVVFVVYSGQRQRQRRNAFRGPKSSMTLM